MLDHPIEEGLASQTRCMATDITANCTSYKCVIVFLRAIDAASASREASRPRAEEEQISVKLWSEEFTNSSSYNAASLYTFHCFVDVRST